MEIFNNINKNIEYLENIFEDCGDVVKRKIPIGQNKESSIYVIYIDDMVNRETIESTVLENLMINIRIAPPDRKCYGNFNRWWYYYSRFKRM